MNLEIKSCSAGRHRRKSQISLAILIGIIVLGLSAAVYYVATKTQTGKFSTDTATSDDMTAAVRDYVQSCLKSTLEDGILELGSTAGIYNIEGWPSYEDVAVYPYYYKSGKAMMPDLSVYESELANYINDNIGFCLNDFEGLSSAGITIESGASFDSASSFTSTYFTNTLITPNGVTATLSYELTAQKQGKEVVVSEFTASREARLLELLQSVTKIVKEIEENPYFIPVQVMLDESELHDFNMSVDVYEEDEVIIIYVTDHNTQINGQPYVLVFASIFNMSNIAPVIKQMEPVIVQPGHELVYVVPARDPENRVMAFFTNDSRFEIDIYTGVVEMIVPSDLKGDTKVVVYASDGEATAAGEVVFRVE